MDEKEIIKKVAFNIKVTRLQRGLTQFQLAEMINVHEKYIGRVESGKQNITIKTLIKLAQALGTTLAKLVTIEWKSEDFRIFFVQSLEIVVFPVSIR